MNTTHSTETAAAILTAARQGNGDFHATRRTTARFCTEALADAAAALVIPANFASEAPAWRTLTRDEATFRLCGWVSWRRVQGWGVAFEASRQAAIAAMPEALAELGAAL